MERPPAGQDNTIAVVDGHWMVRIARTQDARSYHANEVAVLGALGGHRVPQLHAAHHHGIVYEYIRGTRLAPAA